MAQMLTTRFPLERAKTATRLYGNIYVGHCSNGILIYTGPSTVEATFHPKQLLRASLYIDLWPIKRTRYKLWCL
jgi:hypothetical protein